MFSNQVLKSTQCVDSRTLYRSSIHPRAEESANTIYLKQETTMIALLIQPVLAAAGWSLTYLLLGGGVGGAIIIFIVLKMLGK